MFRKNIIRTPGRYGCPVVTSVIFFWFFISFSFSVVVATFSTIRRFSRPPGLVDDDDDDTTITSCVLSSWGWGENPKCVSKPLNGSSAMVDRTICAHKVPSLLIIEHLHHPIPFGQICTHSYCVVVPRKETLSVSVCVCTIFIITVPVWQRDGSHHTRATLRGFTILFGEITNNEKEKQFHFFGFFSPTDHFKILVNFFFFLFLCYHIKRMRIESIKNDETKELVSIKKKRQFCIHLFRDWFD